MVVRIGQKSARPRKTYFKEWRLSRGLTQDVLAERLDTTKSAVSKMENGVSRYNQLSLEAWASALSCDPADLISRPPPANAATEPSISELIERASPEARALVQQFLKTGS